MGWLKRARVAAGGPAGLLALALFALGMLSGFGLASATKSATREPALAAREIELARGVDEAARGAPRAPFVLPSAAPSPVGYAPPSRPAARAALAVTTSIEGDGVYGAGVVIGPHHVLTCFHVVEHMKTIHLWLASGLQTTRAHVVETEPALDLAIVASDVPLGAGAELASVTSLSLGDPLFAMGAPHRMSFSLSSGVVSYVARPYDGLFYVQTDIATNHGSSGGPVLDERGRVIGLASFILRDSQGLAFALPIDYAYRRFARYFAGSLDASGFDAWQRDPSSEAGVASFGMVRTATASNVSP